MSKCLTITAVKNFKLSDSTSEILYGSLHGSPFLIIIIASRKQKLWVCICLIACRIVLCPNITWTYYIPCILHNAKQGHGCSQSSELGCESLCDWCSKIAQEFSLQILHAQQQKSQKFFQFSPITTHHLQKISISLLTQT